VNRRVVNIAGVSQPPSAPSAQRNASQRRARGSGLVRARIPITILLLVLTGPLLGSPLLAGTAAGASPAARAATAAVATPLSVQLIRLTPSALPATGRLVLAGTVTNTSSTTWAAVNVLPFISPTPITNRDDLAVAAKSDPATEVGTRLFAPHEFAAVGTLAPDQTASFQISLKVKDLPINLRAEGVYWIGVYALGQDAAGGIRETLGRARTFIPLVRGTKPTSVAVVVPVRERVRRDPGGRILETSAWSAALAPEGRLGRLGSFISSAGTHPLTLLLDPAVLDAVSNLKDDNPALSLGATAQGSPTPTPTPTETPTSTGTPTNGATPSTTPGTTPGTTQSPSRSSNRLAPPDRANAALWLSEITAAATEHTTLGLGYADPDADALARRRPTMLSLANRLAATTFAGLGIPAIPTVAPPDGWIDADLLGQIPAESMVLISDHAAPLNRTQWRTPTHQDLVFTDAQAVSGGPAPTNPTDALAMRQRIISDAALRISENATSPMVVKLPDDWNPGSSWQLADFFNALAQPWLNLVSLNPTSDQATPTFRASLGFPASARRSEIQKANIGVARTLIQTTTVVSDLLTSKNNVAHDLAGIALNAVSYHARSSRLLTRSQVAATNQAILTRLKKVQVIGTDFVTLSGGSGTLAVTLVNGLGEPIEVGLRPQDLPVGVKIDPVDPVRMAPGERTVLRLHADASGVGVSLVQLSPATSAGTPLGTPLVFRLRTSQVGVVIWSVLGAGGLLLVVMIGLRIRRALRERRWRR
jgi:hypothetical protein